jgi:hypothetical protein
MVQMDRIINAIHSSVPEELWPEILRKIDGPVAADTPADEIEDRDAADEYNPVESGPADEDCWTQCERRPLPPQSTGSARRSQRSPISSQPTPGRR